MNELEDETCGCPNRQKMEEMNVFNEQTSETTVQSIHASDHESDVQAAESTITDQEVATQSVMPSQTPPTRSVGGGLPLVYAIGMIGINFGSEARRDSFTAQIDVDVGQPCPDDPAQMLPFLNDNEEYAEALIWTLEMDGNPVYAIRPEGAFASKAYAKLREFLANRAERVSIPGVIVGKIRLLSGQVVPVIMPEVRGMYGWSITDLVDAVTSSVKKGPYYRSKKLYGSKQPGSDKPCSDLSEDEKKRFVSQFLMKIYHEMRNLGRAPQDRAINFAGTNLFQAATIFEDEAVRCMMLDRIEVERSPACRPDSDCWDVKMIFFNPYERLTQAKEVWRFTIDVSDVIPVSIGLPASWPVWE